MSSEREPPPEPPVTPPTAAAFISYSRDDSTFALRLAEDLKSAGASVWLDQLDIKPGTPWDTAIEDALIAASQMLLVLSPSSAKSANVRDEIAFALEQGKPIIPVLYKDCVVPLRLQRTQRIDVRTDYPQGFNALLQHLQIKHLQPQPAAPSNEAEARAIYQHIKVADPEIQEKMRKAAERATFWDQLRTASPAVKKPGRTAAAMERFLAEPDEEKP